MYICWKISDTTVEAFCFTSSEAAVYSGQPLLLFKSKLLKKHPFHACQAVYEIV